MPVGSLDAGSTHRTEDGKNRDRVVSADPAITDKKGEFHKPIDW